MSFGLPPGRIRGLGRFHVRPPGGPDQPGLPSRAWASPAVSPTPTSWIRPRAGRASSGSIRVSWSSSRTFHDREDTFSIGICNGCQLSALLGWVPWAGIETQAQPRFIQNSSGRFESRFTTVQIMESPAIMLQGMAGATLGIWVAHGEGRAYFPDPKSRIEVLAQGLAPVRFVDDEGEPTTEYPLNPNGSPQGIAALTSPDGRHLAIMPHPERSFLSWQWGWIPEEWKGKTTASPWLKIFQNARNGARDRSRGLSYAIWQSIFCHMPILSGESDGHR